MRLGKVTFQIVSKEHISSMQNLVVDGDLAFIGEATNLVANEMFIHLICDPISVHPNTGS